MFLEIRRAYKFKLEPTLEQRKLLWQWMTGASAMYNYALAQREMNYNQFGKTLNYYDQANELPEVKKHFSWVGEIPSQVLQQKLKDLQTAYDRFFKGLGNFPNYKKRSSGLSIRFPDAKSFEVRERKGKRISFVKLPKIGLLRYVSSQKILGEIKNATVSTNPSGEYFVSFSCVYETPIFANHKPAVGIDRGVRTFGMTSDAECLEIQNEKIKLLELKLACEQKKLSRKVKDSRNRNKQRVRVAKVHAKIARIRLDCIHKITHDLAKNQGVVVIEDLKIKNMSSSAKGSIENPGRMVKQKSGLNRAILRQGWGEFERQLAYKILWNGGKLVKVKAHYTSQTCNSCGHVDKDNRKNESFICVSCGHKDHADVNAAKNILAAGHAVLVCGETSVGVLVSAKTRHVSLKQKPISS